MENTFYDIPGYEGLYQINKIGVVKSLVKNTKKEKLLTARYNRKGYLCYDLYKDKIKKGIGAHQLMGVTFLGHVIDGMKLVVNHINSVRDDNRIENLEIVTNRQNCQGKNVPKTSKYTGVCWCKKAKKWRANIRINGKQVSLGIHKNETDARDAYLKRCAELTQHPAGLGLANRLNPLPFVTMP